MTGLLSVEEAAPGIVRLAMTNGAANAMTAGLRAELDAALARALEARTTRAVLITGRGRGFSLGLNPNEHDHAGAGPSLAQICARIDRARVPVVALIQGLAMGGGCELALAAHYRVALANAQLGLPDIAMGLPPLAGTTQRLPRLAPPDAALDLMLTGQPVSAPHAQRAGLLDAVVDGDLEAAGTRFALGLIEQRLGARPAPGRALPPFEQLHKAVARRRAELPQDGPVAAAGRILDCVDAAAMLPYEAALDYEAAAFEDCRDSAAFRALRHLALAEGRLKRAARGWPSEARPVQTIGIWGWGAAAAALAATLLTTGTAVRLAAPDGTTLTEGVGRVDALLDAARETGRLGDAARAANWARFSAAEGAAGLSDCQVVIEAGTGAWPERERAFLALAEAAAPGAVLVATGMLASPAALAAGGHRPADTLWLNLPDLVPTGRLAEIIRTPDTAPDAIATLGEAMQKMLRFTLVTTQESPSLRVLLGALEAADALVEEGASPYAVDRAMRGWGWAMGPYEIVDRVGLPTLLALRAALPDGDDPMRRPIMVPGQMVAEGRRGRSAGRGYYLYPEGAAEGVPDPALDQVLAGARAALGRAARTPGADEIRAQVLAGMAQAGAGLIRRGAVRRAEEIDLAMVYSAGIARWRGGPMRAADETGLLALRRTLRGMAEREGLGHIWVPDPLIGDLIKNGRHFTDADPVPAGTPEGVSPG